MASGRERVLRKQLLEARANIIRQLDQLRPINRGLTVHMGMPDNRTIIAELEGELREINETLGTEESPDA